MAVEGENQTTPSIPPAGGEDVKLYGSGYSEVLAMAFPVIVATCSGTLMGFVDFWMVSQIGLSSAAAISPSAILVFALISFFVGMLSCTNTFVSQSFAKEDYHECSRYTWQGLWISLMVGVGALALWPLAPMLFAWLGHEAELQPLETVYFQIRLFSIISIVGSTALTGFFQGISRPKLTMVAAIVANLLNVLFNWVLIYGRFGLPAMGIRGSALGTVLAAAVQLGMLLWIFLSKDYAAKYGSRRGWRMNAERMVRLCRVGSGAGLSMLLNVGAWGLFVAWFVGRLGEAPLAASNVATQMLHISFMPTVGLSIAITALVGQNIGRNDLVRARSRARTGLILGMGYMFLMGLLFVVFRHQIPLLFLNAQENPEKVAQAVDLAATILIFAGAFQVFDAMGIICAASLKGAGDTRFPALTTVVVGLVLFLPGCWFFTQVYHWGVIGAWASATIYILVLGVVLVWRWQGRAWEGIDIFMKTAAEAPPVPGRVTPYEPGEEVD